jgi:hypothetical protein
MPSSVMFHRVAVVRTEVSEERTAYIIRMSRIGELGTALAIPKTDSYVISSQRASVASYS